MLYNKQITVANKNIKVDRLPNYLSYNVKYIDILNDIEMNCIEKKSFFLICHK